MTLKTLFLDAGGVLMNPDWAFVSIALSVLGIQATPEALARAEAHVKRELDTPECIRGFDDASRARLYFLGIVQRAGAHASPDLLDRAWDEIQRRHARSNVWAQVPDEVPVVLDRLRKAGLDLVVVSNANGTLHDHLDRLGLLHFFNHVIDSHEVGVEKPDPRIFAIALERSGARPETTIHLGDLYEVDVRGARAAGLRAILLDPLGLSIDRDCPRFASLTDVADAIAAGTV